MVLFKLLPWIFAFTVLAIVTYFLYNIFIKKNESSDEDYNDFI